MRSKKQGSAGRMVGVILVGQVNGLRHTRCGVACLVSCALGIFGSVVALAVYFALTGTFSIAAGMIGFFGPFITIATGVQRALKIPVEELTQIDG